MHTKLDVGQNSKLQIIRCANNSITSLDLSSNNKLWYIDCQSNDLSLLDIKNIPISQITTFYGQSNTNLSCIEVDNVAEATTALTSIDPGVKFSTNCVIDLVTSIDIQGANGASTITDLGGTLQMEASVSPSNADDATYTWSVVNGTGQATIDSNGLLSALADGDVTVQATANDASEVLGSTTVSISGQTSNTQEFYNSKIQVYPNPFTSQIQITSIERIEKVDGKEGKISVEF